MHIIKGRVFNIPYIINNLKKDFDKSELKSRRQILKLFFLGKYQLYLLKNELKEKCGYAVIYKGKTNNNNFLWLDYIAIDRCYRKKGYGKALFNGIYNSVTGLPDFAGMFMEIEIPDKNSCEYQIQLARINFYLKLGVQILPVEYIYPNSFGGKKMYLGVKSKSNFTYDLVRPYIIKTFNTIHTDIAKVNKILKYMDEINKFKITY